MTDDPRPTRHAGDGSSVPVVPEPSFAEQVRTLLHVARHGALSTRSARQEGFPFGSVALYGLDGEGRPTFLISTMAMHTQNLAADPRASLLVTQPGWSGDPLAGARVTLIGPVRRVPATEGDAVRADYLARHESARYWVDFDDFHFHRMEVVDLYYVAGFGAMGWVDPAEYRVAVPDPLADSSAMILEHMNADHADALVLYCRIFGGLAADAATMTGVDRLGMRLRARVGERLRGLRVNFPRQVGSAEAARAVLVEMAREARARG
jgi:putative heme iron utilization protein